MSNRLRAPDNRPKPNRQTPPVRSNISLAASQPPPGKRSWVLGTLAALLLLAVLVGAFSMWVILRHR